jgi:hypothetical protein
MVALGNRRDHSIAVSTGWKASPYQPITLTGALTAPSSLMSGPLVAAAVVRQVCRESSV